MKIEHVALWTQDLERLRLFYETHFSAKASARYHNPLKGFTSYFLSFQGGEPRLEIMTLETLGTARATSTPYSGYAHLALSVGSIEAVDTITACLGSNGVPVVGQPRWTGDGYYESVVEDPDGNLIEITI